MDIRQESLKKHYEWQGKIEVICQIFYIILHRQCTFDKLRFIRINITSIRCFCFSNMIITVGYIFKSDLSILISCHNKNRIILSIKECKFCSG